MRPGPHGLAARRLGVGIAAGAYTHSLGNWLFIVVLITIGPLATTELGTDGWMPELLKLSGPDFPNFATWIFVYVSVIMTVLRFYAGPIVHKFSPIGLLVISAFVAILGLDLPLQCHRLDHPGRLHRLCPRQNLPLEHHPRPHLRAVPQRRRAHPQWRLRRRRALPRRARQPLHRLQAGSRHGQRLSTPEHSALCMPGQRRAQARHLWQRAHASIRKRSKPCPKHRPAELETVQAASKRSVFTTIAMLPAFMLVCYSACSSGSSATRRLQARRPRPP
jgi:DHA2 family metal-tetracycline-proton antiporter-like MFS transporter